MPAGNGGGVFEVVGWLFSARDLASSVVTNAARTVSVAEGQIGQSLTTVSTQVEAVVAGVGKAMSVMAGTVSTQVKKLGSSIFLMGRGMASAAVQTKDFISGLLGIGEAQDEISGKGGGGIFGRMFGGAMGLLQPVIRLLSSVFQPLVEGITDHLSNAMGPLQMTLELLAQDLGPKIAKMMVPLVGILEIVVVNLGTMLSHVMDSGPALGSVSKVVGMLSGFVTKLMPSVLKIANVVMGLVSKLLPIALGLVEQLLPIVEQVILLIADTLADVLPEIGKIMAEIGPLMIETFMELLKAVMPLVPVLLKMLVSMTKLAAPFITAALVGVVEIMKGLTPALQAAAEWVGTFLTALTIGIDKAFAKIGGVETFVKAFKIGLDKWTTGLAEWLVSIPDLVSKLFKTDIPAVWDSFWNWVTGTAGEATTWLGDALEGVLADIPGASTVLSLVKAAVPGLAEGGITTDAAESADGVTRRVGEAGRELILPLQAQTVREFVTPVLADLELPGLDQAVRVLESIDRRLSGILRVEGLGGGQQPAEGSRDSDATLLGAVGIGGI